MNFAGISNLELDLIIKKIIFGVDLGILKILKKPGIHPNYDFRPKATNLKFKIKNKIFTEFTLGINDDFMMR